MKYKYGEFSDAQINDTCIKLRQKIFFLLKATDPKTSDKYDYIQIDKAFDDLFSVLNGMNSLLNYPQELVSVCSLLEVALLTFNDVGFCEHYRKLILDAGNLIMKCQV